MGPPNDGQKRRGHPSLQSRKNAAARSLEIPQWMFDATTCSNPFGAPTLAIRTETIFALKLWATARSGRISRRAPRKKVSQIPQFQLFQTPSSPGRIENCPAESGELYQLALAATEACRHWLVPHLRPVSRGSDARHLPSRDSTADFHGYPVQSRRKCHHLARLLSCRTPRHRIAPRPSAAVPLEQYSQIEAIVVLPGLEGSTSPYGNRSSRAMNGDCPPSGP